MNLQEERRLRMKAEEEIKQLKFTIDQLEEELEELEEEEIPLARNNIRWKSVNNVHNNGVIGTVENMFKWVWGIFDWVLGSGNDRNTKSEPGVSSLLIFG